MPWDRTTPSNPKYRTPQHRALSNDYKRSIRAGRYLECSARPCLFGGAPITNPDGNAPDGVTVGHADNGIDIDGPQHRKCNTNDGAKRGNARSRGVPDANRWAL